MVLSRACHWERLVRESGTHLPSSLSTRIPFTCAPFQPSEVQGTAPAILRRLPRTPPLRVSTPPRSGGRPQASPLGAPTVPSPNRDFSWATPAPAVSLPGPTILGTSSPAHAARPSAPHLTFRALVRLPITSLFRLPSASHRSSGPPSGSRKGSRDETPGWGGCVTEATVASKNLRH